jgi:4-amino-4-deoxy-L-arabinose transferase-like glycosyltransferase
MPPERFSLLLYRTCLLGCFLGLVATLYYLAGLSGYLSHPLLNGTNVAASLLAAFVFLYFFGTQLRERSRLGTLLWLLILVLLVTEVVLGLVPPWSRDALNHHLAIPKLYVEAGKIYEIPFAPYSYDPMLLDMLYTPFATTPWDFAPKLIHGLFGALTGVLLFAYLARRLSPIYGLLGFFFFVSTPAILRLMNWAYVDLGLTFYGLAALLCLLRWNESREIRWMIMAGLCTGFTLATKPNGMLIAFVLGFVLLFMLARNQQHERTKILGWTALFTLLALVPFAPWAIKNLVETGNPFFPAFQGLFAAAGGGGGSGGGAITIWTKRGFLYGESWWQMAALPLRIFIFGRDNSAQYFDGVLNPMLVLFLPWAFKGKWAEEKWLFFAFSLFYLLYAVFLVEMRIRYLLPIIAPLVILLVYGVHNLYLRIGRLWILVAGILLLVAWNGVYLAKYYQSVSPLDYISGNETREGFLTRMVPGHRAISYINQNLSSTARVDLILQEE